ncbi:sugar nucleotide-binding protein [Roseateles sp.]|uniref:sugar nucleotide-binding protein n=1 Tax=Roseateles sp. TaxID=1971397 RepID=UPI003263D4E3
MKILITGLNGTLAPRLAETSRAAGHEVIGWDRAAVDQDNQALSAAWLSAQAVDAIAHLGMSSARFCGWLASRCPNFLFTSSVMVFDPVPDGPHDIFSTRNSSNDYGRYKADCEDAVLLANERPVIARIGWQIDETRPGNNMLLTLDEWQQRDGCVKASRAWTPACSFMTDTAAALLALIEKPLPGVHHLDSNADEAWRFDEVARALAAKFGRDWRVEAHDDYQHDQRLIGGPSGLPPLSARLARL